MVFVVGAAQAKTITVCSSCSVKTIKEALEQASDGDTILVKKGIYKEANIKIDKEITLIGENMPTIDGNKEGEIITIGADNVTVDGFKIINVGLSYTTDYASVRVVNSAGFRSEERRVGKECRYRWALYQLKESICVITW